MSDAVPTETTPPAPHRPPSGLRRRLLHWLGELTTVFLGVYAAFFLNYRATHRQERQRREQLLAWVEEHYTTVLSNDREEIPRLQGIIDDFDKKRAGGQMPELGTIDWIGDYDPSDGTSLLQSGGFDLLDIETIRDIREVETTLRELVSIATHAQQRSDALLLPNHGKDPSVFYDPATRQLRGAYEWVPKAFKDLKGGFEASQASCTKLLAHVKTERERRR